MNEPIRLNQVELLQWHGVVYGAAGTGKTVFSTNTLRYNVFVFDVDDGVNVVKSFRNQRGIPLTNVSIWPVKTIKDFLDGFNWFCKHIKEYGLVTIDSITELQRIMIREYTAKFSDKRQAWGEVLTTTEELMSNFRHMPLEVIWVAHEWRREDSDTGIEMWQPSLQGKSANAYAKHVSWIARLMVAFQAGPSDITGKPSQQVIRVLNFGPDPRIDYKDRSTYLSQYEPPEFDYLIDKMNGLFYNQSSQPLNTGGPPLIPQT